MKFSGVVQKHLGRGKKLGFPTANIEAPKDLEDGLYLGLMDDNPALVFIGPNKTFNEIERRAEIYILDFVGDLYGQEIQVETLKKIREVIKFESSEAMIEQMKADEALARDFFNRYNAEHEQSI